ncbi:MAG: hypothetical protein COA78_25340 [Blastopirellula sp.]|nr:MAG: hypothetical protein COA78_25340 [Blastopirellula sp.]
MEVKTIGLKILTLVLLMAFVEVAVAEEEMSQVELRESFLQLHSRYERAGSNSDYKKQLELAIELHPMLKEINKPRPISLYDFTLGIDHLEQIIAFNESQLNLNEMLTQYYDNAIRETGRENNELAIPYAQKFMELSDQLYGNTSHSSIYARIYLAHLYSLTKHIQEGLVHAIKVKQVLQDHRNESQLFIDASLIEMNLYFHNGEFEKAIKQGIELVTLLEESGRKKTDDYYNIQGSVAGQLNAVKRHQEARVHAGKALNTKLPFSRSNEPLYVRLLLQYGQANVGLEDYEKANQAYDECLKMIAAIPNFSPSERLSTMEEYVPVLRKLGRNQEAEQMEEKIKRMRFDLPLQKSRFAD